MVIDPVCGMKIDASKAAASTVYDGQSYYFCCMECKRRFEVDPEAFLGREIHTSQAGYGTPAAVK